MRTDSMQSFETLDRTLALIAVQCETFMGESFIEWERGLELTWTARTCTANYGEIRYNYGGKHVYEQSSGQFG